MYDSSSPISPPPHTVHPLSTAAQRQTEHAPPTTTTTTTTSGNENKNNNSHEVAGADAGGGGRGGSGCGRRRRLWAHKELERCEVLLEVLGGMLVVEAKGELQRDRTRVSLQLQ